jgi:hypothetical protein
MVVFRASRPFHPGHGGHCCCRVTFRLPCFTQIVKELLLRGKAAGIEPAIPLYYPPRQVTFGFEVTNNQYTLFRFAHLST